MRRAAPIAAGALLAALGSGLVGTPSASQAAADAGPDPRTFSVARAADTVYLARGGEIRVVSVATPTAPRTLGSIELSFTPRRIEIDGKRLIVAAETHGVHVVDVADPAAPRAILAYDGYARVRHALALGDRLLLAAHRDGLQIVDVELPDRPRRRARVSTRGEMTSLALDGTRLATAEGQAGVRLFDLTDADRPRELARWTRIAAGALDVALVGDRLWVAAGRRGLLVLDVAVEERVLLEIATRHPVHLLARDGQRMLVGDSRGVFALPLDAPDAEPVRIALPRRPVVTGLAADGGLVAVALDTGWALVTFAGETEPRVIWPVRNRRMRVTFD